MSLNPALIAKLHQKVNSEGHNLSDKSPQFGFFFYKKAYDVTGLPFIGGEIQFTADFVEYQQIVAQTCEATFLCGNGLRAHFALCV